MFISNPRLKSLVMNHILCIFGFFFLYSLLFWNNKENFTKAKNIQDILYFTTSTHSSTGYGDITATTTLSKMVTVLHHFTIIILTVQFFWCFLCKND